MLKFFKVVDGQKFYCDETGKLIEKDGKPELVPESDVTAVDVEKGVDEATKMLKAAFDKATERGDEEAAARIKEASEAVGAFFEAVAEAAKSHKPAKVEVEKEAGFDADELLKNMEGKVGRKSQGSHVIQLSEKDIAAIRKSTDRSDLTGDVIEPQREAGISRDPQRQVFMEQIADTQETNSDNVEWVEVTGESGAPATTAELAAIPEKDYTFQVYRQPVEKISVINKHSVELLKYGPELVAAVRRMLDIDLNIVVDGQLLSGNGTTPNLQGVLGVATELDATAIGAQEVANPNLFDVLRIAGTKIASAGKGQYQPNFVVLHPNDTEKFDLTKDTEGRYIMPPFYDAAGRRIRGARIVENTGITAGTFLMGDFRYLHVRTKGGVEVEFSNSDGDDFSNDILSIKLRRFLAAYVRNNDSGAFQTGTIADIITALTPA